MGVSPDEAIRIPGVQLFEVLGKGNFGEVYRGRHQGLDVEVAVKIVETTAADPAVMDRALREARLMARLDHPNLLRIFDAGWVGNSLYLVLEMMDGGSCQPLRSIPPQQALDLTRQLLSGLQALHEAHVLHRDIKPDNCLFRKKDLRVKLADLGIAVEHTTRDDQVLDVSGTLPFMAPELFQAPPRFSTATDIYALGLTLACMVLEEDPFPHGTWAELFAWITKGKRPRISVLRPDLPPVLAFLIERMISVRTSDRPQTAAEALAALGKVSLEKKLSEAPSTGDRTTIGSWILGGQVYQSPNWNGYIVTHRHSGINGYLSHMQPDTKLARISHRIVEAVEKVSFMDHPGVLDVMDWGVFDDRLFVVTAARGQTLTSLVISHGVFDELEVVEFGISLADALHYLHSQGLVYQVVEPNSVVVTADARSVLLGWPIFCVPIGTSALGPDKRLTRVFVERYCPPEAVNYEVETIQPAVDLYGLGATLFFLLTGNHALVGTEEAWTALKSLAVEDRQDCPPITAPTAHLIADLMNPDPAKRPASAAWVRDRFRRIAQRLGGPSSTEPLKAFSTATTRIALTQE